MRVWFTSQRHLRRGAPRPRLNAQTPSHLLRAVIGKAEGSGREWHGHVSALTVAPEFRRLGLARTLMVELERASDK